MLVTLKDIITLVKGLPEACLEEAFETLTEIKKKAEDEKEAEEQSCPSCKSAHIVRNGKNRGKQMYLCRHCKKSFTETATAAVFRSNGSATVWKQVISDTVDGIPIDQTADSLDLHHDTVFNMRHKILYCVEQSLIAQPTALIGVCETDETYVLESEK